MSSLAQGRDPGPAVVIQSQDPDLQYEVDAGVVLDLVIMEALVKYVQRASTVMY